MNSSLCVSLVAVLCLAGGCTSVPRDATATTSIPKISRIAKIQIGHSTQEDLAKQWGEGKTITGGHPNSGRLWRVNRTSWIVSADGFDYSKRGLVVDSLQIYEGTGGMNDVPYAKISQNSFSWLGEITLGMSWEKVMGILEREAVSFTTTKDGCEANAKGFHALESSIYPLKIWTASLGFTNGLLNRLTLSASQ